MDVFEPAQLISQRKEGNKPYLEFLKVPDLSTIEEERCAEFIEALTVIVFFAPAEYSNKQDGILFR